VLEISVTHNFQGYFSRTFQELQFPGFSRTKVIFHDFPGPGNLKKKIQDFPGGVGTLYFGHLMSKLLFSMTSYMTYRPVCQLDNALKPTSIQMWQWHHISPL